MSNIHDRTVKNDEFIPLPDDDLIICRCEEITKGEIRRAVYDGMVTMEEMRRYLRNGMGLCQGQICEKHVKRIMAQELGCPPLAVEPSVSRAPMRPIEMEIMANDGGNRIMKDKNTDVIVVGSGSRRNFSGLLSGSKKGLSVLVLEGNESIGHGGSSRNGGGVRQSGRDPRELPFAMYGIKNIWPTLSEELGVNVEYHQGGNLRLGKTEKASRDSSGAYGPGDKGWP